MIAKWNGVLSVTDGLPLTTLQLTLENLEVILDVEVLLEAAVVTLTVKLMLTLV